MLPCQPLHYARLLGTQLPGGGWSVTPVLCKHVSPVSTRGLPGASREAHPTRAQLALSWELLTMQWSASVEAVADMVARSQNCAWQVSPQALWLLAAVCSKRADGVFRCWARHTVDADGPCRV